MKTTEQYLKDAKFNIARMISWSKSTYRQQYPTHMIIFNANIFTEEEGKVWYGDLDLTLDGDKLQEVATDAGRTLYVLYEMDGRFGKENQDVSKLQEVAVMCYKP